MNTLFTGQNIVHLQRVDSTNRYALQLLSKQNVPEGTVIWTDEQYKGRGQRGNNWMSQAYQNLTFSVVLYPRFLAPDDHFLLNKLVTVALKRLLRDKLYEDVQIKWPNDIYIQNLKTAGILIENSWKGNRIGSSVIGVGLNVNQIEFGDTASNATSLKQQTGKFFELRFLLEEFCQILEHLYIRLKENPQSLDKEFERSLFGLNQWKNYEVNGEQAVLKVTGVSKQGRLMVEDKLGNPMKFEIKEIALIRD
ncbi:biotin--[acetyl-CoA-carboxylase] ligase [Salibacter halophilus]|uniref:Biotin--[acetyl-CoA-carboxylase] ligase n=1 Tax=Salibacter halophilus TaxID=1803916 RepID=A0A6N6MB10_9FLAO|nr:biotin--[acetyl-CoA-carboxylase] ligase [Salibacter halophilus]KAB1066179.1 biotin--[acetyl-CoA-carboxylase] ligase [Salibacter halophilus]